MHLAVKLSMVLTLLSGITSCSSDQKIVYIDMARVFEGFEMKKDYDARIEKDLSAESHLLDSVNKLMQTASDSISIQKLKKDYYLAEQVFNSKFQSLSQQYTSDVKKRLNQYINEFGEANGYSFILGANGQGSIMYAAKEGDVTKQLIEYVNKKY